MPFEPRGETEGKRGFSGENTVLYYQVTRIVYYTIPYWSRRYFGVDKFLSDVSILDLMSGRILLCIVYLQYSLYKEVSAATF
jgi:hypothetical protein